jgi:beta-lactamase regulating signal transducer with metallopeptidase domain
MNSILELSLHGSLAFLLVWILDRVLAGHMRTVGRRWWWIAVPSTFLVSIPLSIIPVVVSTPIAHEDRAWGPVIRADAATQEIAGKIGLNQSDFWLWLWLVGVVIYLLMVIVQTRTAILRWSRERLSTDSKLLDLLEDCKQEVGITAPIGLVISDCIFTPAILGWLRPRILLPKDLVSSMSRPQLRNVMFHELAHFRSLDVPPNWLFTLARAIHWFNPCAHLAFYAWTDFREEAADETAMTWMKAPSGVAYGETLLHALRGADKGTPPFGALAIGESIHNLKRRITMIKHHQNKSSRFLLASTVLLLITVGFIVRPIQADETTDSKSAAVAAMQIWLKEIDQNQYAQSWKDASASFQKALTSDQWTAALNGVRTPLGKCTDRKLASSMHQTEVPSPTGPQKGDFVVAQFNSSFDGLAYAVETVCFEKASDGTWKASGYYIKPKL